MLIALQCNVRVARWVFAIALAFVGVPFAAYAQPSSAALAPQSSVVQGLTVKVSPKLGGPADTRWEFSVVFDTHSVQLNDDPTQTTVLVTDDGRVLKPTAWNGAAPGGHHREGVLLFDAPTPPPIGIALKMTRLGEAAPRSFRWQL